MTPGDFEIRRVIKTNVKGKRSVSMKVSQTSLRRCPRKPQQI